MPSICKVLSLPENRKYQCLLLTHEENQKTDDLIILLGKFKTATKTICNEKYPTISLILPIIKVLKDHIFTSVADSDFIAQIKMLMLTNLSTRYQDIKVRNTLKIATYLDPRFRNLDFDPNDDIKAEDLLLEKTLELAKASNCQPPTH